jgi:hypothetical protein
VKKAVPTSDADTALTKLIKLLGPPPLLRNENSEDFKEVFAGLFAALGPEDFLMEANVFYLAIETYRIFRLTRYEAVTLNKWENDQRHAWAEKSRSTTLKSGMKQIREKYPHAAETDPQYQKDIAKLQELAAADYEDDFNYGATDLDYVQATEERSAFLEKIELRINRAHKRRNDILRQIAWYRLGLSKKLRKVSDATIEGAGGSLEATSDVVTLIPQGDADGRAI